MPLFGLSGTLRIQADGNWSYSAGNSQSTIQQLDLGETLTDTLTIFSVDRTPHDIVITIHGSDEG